VESVKLSSDSSVKGLEAEAAQARRAVAQMEAAAKKDRANWVSELEMQKFEVCSSVLLIFSGSAGRRGWGNDAGVAAAACPSLPAAAAC